MLEVCDITPDEWIRPLAECLPNRAQTYIFRRSRRTPDIVDDGQRLALIATRRRQSLTQLDTLATPELLGRHRWIHMHDQVKRYPF